MPTDLTKNGSSRQFWLRLCISLAAAYLLFVLGFILYEYWRVVTAQQGWGKTFFLDTELIYQCYPSTDAACEQFQPYDMVNSYDIGGHDIRDYHLISLRWDRLLPIAVAPIALGGAVLLLALWTIGGLTGKAPSAAYAPPSKATAPVAAPARPEALSHSDAALDARKRNISWTGAILGAAAGAFFGREFGGLPAAIAFLLFYFVGRTISSIPSSWSALRESELSRNPPRAPAKYLYLALVLVSAFFLLVALPVSIIGGHFKTGYLFFSVFWFAVAYHSYAKVRGVVAR